MVAVVGMYEAGGFGEGDGLELESRELGRGAHQKSLPSRVRAATGFSQRTSSRVAKFSALAVVWRRVQSVRVES